MPRCLKLGKIKSAYIKQKQRINQCLNVKKRSNLANFLQKTL
ncbi:hypothetical protein MHA_2332 [Mannheimia haemolytica PHL213]|nr:hypothetical protein MHA_2332 [Mannheimia haemolytica PHL213]